MLFNLGFVCLSVCFSVLHYSDSNTIILYFCLCLIHFLCLFVYARSYVITASKLRNYSIFLLYCTGRDSDSVLYATQSQLAMVSLQQLIPPLSPCLKPHLIRFCSLLGFNCILIYCRSQLFKGQFYYI